MDQLFLDEYLDERPPVLRIAFEIMVVDRRLNDIIGIINRSMGSSNEDNQRSLDISFFRPAFVIA